VIVQIFYLLFAGQLCYTKFMKIKPEIKYGLWGGLSLIGWTLLQYAMGFHTDKFWLEHYSGYGSYLIVLIFVWLGLNEKRKDYNGNFSVRRGVKESMYQLIFTAIISSLFMFVYDYKINALWVERLIEWQRANGAPNTVFLRLANDPQANAVVLSNTETHLCLYFLGIVVVGASMAFMLSAIIANSNMKTTEQIQG
jgi:hypothetical protein